MPNVTTSEKQLCEKCQKEMSGLRRTKTKNERNRKRIKRKKQEKKNSEREVIHKQEFIHPELPVVYGNIFSGGEYKAPIIITAPLNSLRERSIGWGLAFWNVDIINDHVNKVDGKKLTENDNEGEKATPEVVSNLIDIDSIPGSYPSESNEVIDIDTIYNEPAPKHCPPPIQPVKMELPYQNTHSKDAPLIDDDDSKELDPLKNDDKNNYYGEYSSATSQIGKTLGNTNPIPLTEMGNTTSGCSGGSVRENQGGNSNGRNGARDQNPHEPVGGYTNEPQSISRFEAIIRNLPTNREKIRSVALFFSFGPSIDFVPSPEELHKLGFHPIFCRVPTYSPDNCNRAKDFITDVALNCWANGWRITLFVSSHSAIHPQLNADFIWELRKVFIKQTLSIIAIYTTRYSNVRWNFFEAGADAVITSGKKQALLNIFYEEYKTSGAEEGIVKFYNKAEPYYEFTNFFQAPVFIDSQVWPSTEHYFQASKFDNPELREKIRNHSYARDAFRTAREYDRMKRGNWEFPKGNPYKEHIMRKALMCKFTQHKQLKYLILSTGTARIHEHTANDYYWGDGGRNGRGLNRLGELLQELRTQLMFEECRRMSLNYRSYGAKWERWIIPELNELNYLEGFHDVQHRII
ncbi:14075_t:CDS:2 [Acaulospora morrowiae]|uniref:14075_t:CDS:1 n=1 Tax=Acaulospora morrowiae TaxID=94023 RepID=A0A9N9B4D7_9GLOM|nr:14075_t:CDS:2 [Acaulospora morrowiae]